MKYKSLHLNLSSKNRNRNKSWCIKSNKEKRNVIIWNAHMTIFLSQERQRKKSSNTNRLKGVHDKKETLQCEKDGDESWFCINLFILYLDLNIIHDKILFIWAAINLLKYSNNNPLQGSSILLKHLKVTTWPHVMWRTF